MRKNRTKFILALLVIAAIGCHSKGYIATAQDEPGTAVNLILFSSNEGMDRFDDAIHRVDFFKLANHFESQTNRASCGPTTLTIVLNTLRQEALRTEELALKPDQSLISAANRKYFNPERTYVFNRYTQNNVFDASYSMPKAKTKTQLQMLGEPVPAADGEAKADWGFQIRHLNDLVLAHGLHSTLHVVSDDISGETALEALKSGVAAKDTYVIVNYKRTALGQTGGGHISPVAAYDEDSDSFLILDVNPNRADWVWVESSDLIAAMRTFDTVENRGFLIVSDTN